MSLQIVAIVPLYLAPIHQAVQPLAHPSAESDERPQPLRHRSQNDIGERDGQRSDGRENWVIWGNLNVVSEPYHPCNRAGKRYLNGDWVCGDDAQSLTGV